MVVPQEPQEYCCLYYVAETALQCKEKDIDGRIKAAHKIGGSVTDVETTFRASYADEISDCWIEQP